MDKAELIGVLCDFDLDLAGAMMMIMMTPEIIVIGWYYPAARRERQE
jgi:hypothetical protein